MQQNYPTQRTSQKQIAANRLNALNSTGPQSPEGKTRVTLNALRHGLTGQVTMMTPENRAAHDRHHAEYLALLKPEDSMQRDLALNVAADAWRLKTARSIEQNIYAIGQADIQPDAPQHVEVLAAFSAAQTFLDESRQFQLLTLYEQRLQRSLQKNLAALRAMQAERAAARAHAFEKAKLFALMCYAEGKPYHPADNPSLAAGGFVFTSAEINAAIRAERQYRKAVHYSRNGWNLTDGYGSKNLALIDLPADTEEAPTAHHDASSEEAVTPKTAAA